MRNEGPNTNNSQKLRTNISAEVYDISDECYIIIAAYLGWIATNPETIVD
jgi:hypothetical protein